MKKTDAIELLGGTVRAAAEAVGISPQAVSQWPEDLPAAISDRVQAALARAHAPEALKQPLRAPEVEAAAKVA